MSSPRTSRSKRAETDLFQYANFIAKIAGPAESTATVAAAAALRFPLALLD